MQRFQLDLAEPGKRPEFIQRRSLASFIRVTARVFNWPDAATAVSCEPIRAKKSSPGRNASPVRSFSSWLKRSANRGWALIPVPTAVPPCANCCKAGSTLDVHAGLSHLLRPATEHLAHAYRHRIHQVGAAGLHIGMHFAGLALDSLLQVAQRRQQAFADLEGGTDVGWSRE